MKTKLSKIEQYKLDADTYSGLLLAELAEKIPSSHNIGDAHRDDHFSIMFAMTGEYHFKIDFEDVLLKAPFILCIEPQKIHQLILISQQSGWVMAIDEFLLEPEFKHLLTTKLDRPLLLDEKNILVSRIQTILGLALDLQKNSPNLFTHKSISYLMSALFCLLAVPSDNIFEGTSKETRGQVIEYAFRELLRKHYKSWKKPGEYATELAITTSHLNDVLKDTTGLSTSALIQQYIVLEAKRLLYATDKEVREIAYELGYDDVVYFSKLFKKISKHTCLQFRKQFRD